MERRTSVEIQAYSVEEAVRLALEELALTEDEVDIEILSDAGPDEGAEALVRVTATGMASQPEPRAATGRPSPRGPRSATPRAASPSGSRPTGAPSSSGRRWGGAERGGRRVPGDRPSQRGTPPGHTSAERVDAADEQVAKDTVHDLLERMGVVADVVAVDNPSSVPLNADDPPTIFIDVLGQDLGLLIGRRGDNLAQIQYLINLLVNRRLETWTRVIVDVEGYRSRREESLVGLAERVARQVARSRRPIMLEPMPPNERRIVHLTLQTNPEVMTESTGEGNQRRITVQPRG